MGWVHMFYGVLSLKMTPLPSTTNGFTQIILLYLRPKWRPVWTVRLSQQLHSLAGWQLTAQTTLVLSNTGPMVHHGAALWCNLTTLPLYDKINFENWSSGWHFSTLNLWCEWRTAEATKALLLSGMRAAVGNLMMSHLPSSTCSPFCLYLYS